MSYGTSARAIIVGRMGKPIEIRTIGQKGTRKGEFSLATNSGYGDRKDTSWHSVVVWNEKKMEVLEQYAGKGALVMVEGELKVRKWTKDGQDRYITEIDIGFDGIVEILKGPDDASGGGGGSQTQTRERQQQRREPEKRAFDADFDADLDDDVPF